VHRVSTIAEKSALKSEALGQYRKGIPDTEVDRYGGRCAHEKKKKQDG
jgi:hypothetical protein